MTESNEPTTEAGRELLDHDVFGVTNPLGNRTIEKYRRDLKRYIIAIEAEAALAASRAETAAAVAAVDLARTSLIRAREQGSWAMAVNAESVLDAIITDLTAAAQAHDAEVARAAVEPWRKLIVRAMPLLHERSPHHVKAYAECDVTDLCALARALLAQSPAASGEGD